jgi:hypothetical protein
MLDMTEFEPITKECPNLPEVLRAGSIAGSSEVLLASSEVFCTSLEVEKNGSSLEIYTPTPKSAIELGSEYGKSDRTIQTWIGTIESAYFWLEESALKTGSSNNLRYTPLCQELIAEYRSSGLSAKSWVASVHAANPDKFQPAQPLQTRPVGSPPGLPTVDPQSLIDPPDAPIDAEFIDAKDEQGNAIIPYKPSQAELDKFKPPQIQTFRYTQKTEFIETAKQQTEQGIDNSKANSVGLAEALINHMSQEGQVLGIDMFHAKYGSAQEMFSNLESALAKKQGLVQHPNPS